MSTENKFKCIFCKDEFDDKESLQVHFRKHGNRDFNDSINAAKRKSSKVAIMKKEASCSDEADGGSIVKCDVCTAEFDTVAKAICHKHKVHKDDRIKHFCPWCGKQFPIKHLWDNHMDSHEEEKIPEETLLCDHCNFEFYTSSALSYHTNSFHRQEVLAVQLTNIPTASKQVKIVNKDTLSVYYCHLCGQDYLQKFALQKHITTTHPEAESSENFPEDILRCALCDAFFFNKPAYETHLMCHTHDDMYIGNESEREALLQDENFKIETLPPNEEKFDENILNNSGKKVERLVSDLDPSDFLTNEDEENSSNSSSEEPDDEDSDDMSQENSDEAKSEPPEEQRKAITLDEFFNMNKDVFGEISGFQGVVEVPTQVINSRLNRAIRKPVPVRKANKPPPKLTQGAKIISFDSFQKLRQQGLVIKQPKAHASNVRRLNTVIPINKKIQQINSINKPNVIPVAKTINKSVDVRTARIHPSVSQVGIKIHGNIQSKPMFKSGLNKEGLATIKKMNDTSKSSNFPIVKMASNVVTTQKKEASPVMKKLLDPKNGTTEETQVKSKLNVSKPNVSMPNKDGVTIVKKIMTDGLVEKKLPLPISKISEVIKTQTPETVAALKKHGNVISLNADTVTILKKLSSGDNSESSKKVMPVSKGEPGSVKSLAEDGDEFAHSDDSFMSDGADFSDDFDDDDLDNLGIPTNIKITNIPIKNPISIINKMPQQKPFAKAIQDASKETVTKIISGPASKTQNMKSSVKSINNEVVIRKRPHNTPISELKAATESSPSPPKRRVISPTFQSNNEDVDSDFSDDLESDNMMEVTRIPVKMPAIVKAVPSVSKANVAAAIAKPSIVSPASKSNLVSSAAKTNIVPSTAKSNVPSPAKTNAVPSMAKPNVLSTTKPNVVPSAAKADAKKTVNLDVLEKLRKQGLISVVKKPKDDDSQLGDSNCLTVKSGG